MIPKSENRFSEKIMLKRKRQHARTAGRGTTGRALPMLARRRPIGQNSLSIWAKA
jgi:hypothetical protein